MKLIRVVVVEQIISSLLGAFYAVIVLTLSGAVSVAGLPPALRATTTASGRRSKDARAKYCVPGTR